jgi:hypothetical protein
LAIMFFCSFCVFDTVERNVRAQRR